MLDNKVSVIDLGTNTFHIVIFRRDESGRIEEIYRKRHHIFLSENGISEIGKSAMQRAKEAILDFGITLREFQPDTLQIVGTAALRRASNGPMLKGFIEKTLATEVMVISGQREAELIAKGVQWELDSIIDNAMIMDIGGGSVEFIHVRNNNIQWLQSFPIGVGELYNASIYSDPITSLDLEKINRFIISKTQELIDYLATSDIPHLIGSSGSFELIPSIKEGIYPPTLNDNRVTLEDFERIKTRLFSASEIEREQIKGLPPVRAKLVVVAFVLMDWYIRQSKTMEISISKYAVKEGLVAEIMQESA